GGRRHRGRPARRHRGDHCQLTAGSAAPDRGGPPMRPADPDATLTADRIAALFTAADGAFLCARWGRPVAPVVFGLDDASLAVFRAAMVAAFAHARHQLTDTDPQMGANLMVFAV